MKTLPYISWHFFSRFLESIVILESKYSRRKYSMKWQLCATKYMSFNFMINNNFGWVTVLPQLQFQTRSFSVHTLLGAWSGFGIQPCYEVPIALWVKIIQTVINISLGKSNYFFVARAVRRIILDWLVG